MCSPASSKDTITPTNNCEANSNRRCGCNATIKWTDISYLFFNFISGIAVTFINKICFSRIEFGYPTGLCIIHLIFTLLGVEFLYKLNIFKRCNIKLHDPNFIALVLVIGISKPLNNNSLKLNSIGFYQLVKLLVSPCVVLLEYILDRKIISRNRMILLFIVCLSVMVSSRAALAFSHNGTICAMVWIPFSALYKVQWGRVKEMYDCSTLALMGAVLPFAICVQAAISPLVDPPGILDFQWTPEAIFWIGLSGIFAFLVNLSGFLVMGNISALSHVLLGQLKTAIIMIGATILFGSKYTTIQLVGASVAVIAIILYSYITIKEENKNNIPLDDEMNNNLILPLVQLIPKTLDLSMTM